VIDPDKIASHEDAAHEKRNWVRLTFTCNDHCVFCLDSDAHDGRMRDRDEVKRQILDGRASGATRLILSGGEPTIHPQYVDFIRLGARAGYAKIQTVTNGRLFAYREFLGRCVDAGLSEITFSIHGPNARVHDALVGVKGAYEQEIAGLVNALADGRAIVNVDIVINRANVKFLDEMLAGLYALGVREFDLLQVVPFGRAFTEGRDTLFYDLAEARPHLLAALAWSMRPDVHIWMNRFPPQHLEGYEHLIQDPYKLVDEVRGRKEEFARLLDEGEPLDCRDPARCRYCYLERLCDTLDEVRLGKRWDVARVDSASEATQPPVFGGDPASARKVRLPLAGERVRPIRLEETGATIWRVVAPSVRDVRAPDGVALELECDDYDGIETLARVTSALARTPAVAEKLLAAGDFEVLVELNVETAPWLLARTDVARIAIRQPNHERLTESQARDVDLVAFFRAFRHEVSVENVPECVLGRPPRPSPPTYDAAMRTPDGKLEIFRFARRFIADGYYVKSLRCASCRAEPACRGMHVSFVRAHGFDAMNPIARP
jgi:MoaA/NifB/PqqE/SkfB family radical SAM enzyme